MKKTLLFALASVVLANGMTSCDNTKDDTSDFVVYTTEFNFADENYNINDYWVDVYEPEQGNFTIYPYTTFTHRATVTEWAGTKYYSYKGFCPSRVVDSGSYPEDWVNHQWASIAPLRNAGYLVACWDVAETDNVKIDDRSCAIGFGYVVRPLTFTITNTTYGFYGMKDGTGFSKPFGAEDWCKLLIHGVDAKGNETAVVSVDLAAGGTILQTWKTVDVSALGEVTAVYFTMSSSDTGEWGMNNPAYFALAEMQVYYSSDSL